ncbi:MAG TPA: phosphotransferase, partial [Thermomicrobiaceae bacterium]|nr:phosphotransferase [Thermomicrobiaceae bacterium]
MHVVTQIDTIEFLERRFATEITSVTPIGFGAWSQAFRFDRDGRSWVIRWSEMPDNFARDAFAVRFVDYGLPVPPVTDVGHDERGYFAIAPFVEGGDFELLPAEPLERLLPSLLETFRALRRVDLDRLGTSGYGIWDGSGDGLYPSWRTFLLDDKDDSPGSLIRGWRANLIASPLGTAAYDDLRQRFTPLVEQCPNERRLVHSDLINHNVLAAGDRITAVLDWGSALYGDPLWDIAWLAFYE